MRRIWISAVLLLTACHSGPRRGISIDSELRPLVSSDAKALIGIRFDRLQQAPLYKTIQSRLKLPVPDLLENFSDAVALWNGKEWILLGRSSSADLDQKLARYGNRSTSFGKYRIWYSAGAVGVIDNRVAVGGKEATVKAELTTFDQKTGSVPEELKQQLEELPSSSQFWEASRGGLPSFGVQSGSDIGSMLANIVNDVSDTGLGIDIDTGLHLRGRILCTSDQTGKRVHDGLRAAIGFARLSTNDRDLLPVYDAFQVDQNGSTVTIKADLARDQVNRLLDVLDKFRASGRRAPAGG